MALCILICSWQVQAQASNNDLVKGNEAYKKADYATAATYYEKALKADANNVTALFNKGNALYKQGKVAEANKLFEAAAAKATGNTKAKALYNKGVTEAQQKQWAQAIASLKESLKLNAGDNETRDNLQKAMNELKKQEQQKQQPKQNNKQPKEQPKEKKPEPKMSKQQMENELNRLRNEEKQLQKELQQKKATSGQPLKDW